MKLPTAPFATCAMLMIAASPAFAVDTTKVYNSGILVLAFLAFCALIVVIQVIPSILLMIGSIRSMIKGTSKKGRVHARVKS